MYFYLLYDQMEAALVSTEDLLLFFFILLTPKCRYYILNNRNVDI